MRRMTALILALMMIFALSACGGKEDNRSPAIAAYEEAIKLYNEAAELMNEKIELVDEGTHSVFEKVSGVLNQYCDILEGEAELTDEQVAEMTRWLEDAKGWAQKTKTELDALSE